MSITTKKPVRLSYCFLTSPRPNTDPNKQAEYGATLLIPKTDKDTIAQIEEAVKQARIEGVAKGIPNAKNFLSPLRDGDGQRPRGGEYGPECKGMMVMNSKTKNPIKVVDRKLQPIIDPMEIYSGMWALVNVGFKAFSVPGNSGITVYLNGVQKVRDDAALGGAAPKPEDMFSAVEDDDDDLGL